jgi:hypothetical protein
MLVDDSLLGMRLITLALLFVEIGLCGLGFLSGQEIDPAGGKIRMAIPKAEDPSESTFRLGATGLVFRYPGDFKHEDTETLIRRSYRTVVSLDAQKDPSHVGADPCSPTILAVGIDTPEDVSRPGEKRDDFAASSPTGGITLADVDRKCVDAKTDEDAAVNMVSRIQGNDGLTSLTPASQFPVYRLDGHTTALAIAQGFSKDSHGKRVRSSGMTFVGSVSMVYREHLLVWTFVSNDAALFNRMLTCRVQFDDQPSWPLVPFSMQSKE